jgi:hypothetical protein
LEFGTQGEAVDAESQRGAMAAEEPLEKGFELERTGDGLFDFGEFAGGQFFPARPRRYVVTKAV